MNMGTRTQMKIRRRQKLAQKEQRRKDNATQTLAKSFSWSGGKNISCKYVGATSEVLPKNRSVVPMNKPYVSGSSNFDMYNDQRYDDYDDYGTFYGYGGGYGGGYSHKTVIDTYDDVSIRILRIK